MFVSIGPAPRGPKAVGDFDVVAASGAPSASWTAVLGVHLAGLCSLGELCGLFLVLVVFFPQWTRIGVGVGGFVGVDAVACGLIRVCVDVCVDRTGPIWSKRVDWSSPTPER